jgi:hypothetical protein
VIERVHSLAVDQPEKLVFYDRHGRAIGDNSSNIELSEIDTGIENTNQITGQLHESLQSETHETHEFEQDGIAEEEEMSLPGSTHGVKYNSNDDEHGQDEPPDQTNTIDIKESNLVSQTVDSLERGEQVSGHNIQGEVEHEQHLRRSTRTKVPTQRYKPSMSDRSSLVFRIFHSIPNTPFKGALKPIRSGRFLARVEVDLINMRKCRQRNSFGITMKYIVTVKDHFTGFVIIDCISRKTPELGIFYSCLQ